MLCRRGLHSNPERRGIAVGAHILSIGEERDRPFDPVRVDFAELSALKSKEFPVICESAGERMKQEIARAAQNLDSVGGVVRARSESRPGSGTDVWRN